MDLARRKGTQSIGIEASTTSEVSTLQLEFTYLSFLTGEPKYAAATDRVMDILERKDPPSHLVPIFIDPSTANYIGRTIRLGSRGDSYYEYLYKQHHQALDATPRSKRMHEMWLNAWTSVKDNLVGCSPRQRHVYIGEYDFGVPGSVAARYKAGKAKTLAEREEAMQTCDNQPGISVFVRAI